MVIRYNVRMGDPETSVMLRIKSDIGAFLKAYIKVDLDRKANGA